MERWILGMALMGAAAWALLGSRRRPRDPELERFLVRLKAAVEVRHKDVVCRGVIPGEFSMLMEIGGQETPVPLHETWRRAKSFPDDFDRIVDELVAEVRELGLDRVTDHDFEDVAGVILPQIRSRTWLQEKGRFGDSGLVYRALGDDLVVVYVIDDSDCMTFVCRAHLRRWRLEEEDLFHLATANLQRASGFDAKDVVASGAPVVLHTGDGYDAARLLLVQQEAPRGLLIAMPDRDLLWVGGEQDSDLSHLMSVSEELNRDASHPVSPRVYRLVDGSLEPVDPITLPGDDTSP